MRDGPVGWEMDDVPRPASMWKLDGMVCRGEHSLKVSASSVECAIMPRVVCEVTVRSTFAGIVSQDRGPL